jgi:hypothetical protein
MPWINLTVRKGTFTKEVRFLATRLDHSPSFTSILNGERCEQTL